MIQFELKDYQQAGVDFLIAPMPKHHRGVLLADDMGLGKTVMTVAAAEFVAHTVLVVCPGVARKAWFDAWWHFMGREAFAIEHGEQARQPPDIAVLVISYSLLPQLPVCDVDLLVLDEVHLLKERESNRSVDCWTKRVPRAKRTWGLSGTPALNHYGEMWNYCRHLFPRSLIRENRTIKKHASFLQRYTTGIHDGLGGYKVTGSRRGEELQERIAPYILRRTKEQVNLKLPPLKITTKEVDQGAIDYFKWFSDFQYGPPERVQADVAKQMGWTQAQMKAFNDNDQMLEALSNLAAGKESPVQTMRRWIGLSKVDAAEKFVRENVQHFHHSKKWDKVVVFCWHRHVIEELQLRWRDLGTLTLYGGTPAPKKARVIEKFNTDPAAQILICNSGTAGTAIDLTVANNVVVVESDWTPAINAQCIMRCHRIGQVRPVSAYLLAMKDSIDVQITRAAAKKSRALTILLDS